MTDTAEPNITDPKAQRMVENKIAKAERASAARLSGGITPTREPLGSGEPNRHGMPKLPPGQSVTVKWPVLDLGITPEVETAEWKLTISGLVGQPVTFDWEAFMALPQVSDDSDFHCVTRWSLMDSTWGGVRLSDALGAAGGPAEGASHVFFTAYDGYTTNLTLAEATDDDVLLVHTWNGEPLPREHGGPVRVIVPKKYAWKGAKWVKEIQLNDRDKLGFWEKRGYSNTAEPWYEDRYA